MKNILDKMKEILKELSVIPLFFAFLAVVLLIGWILPDGLVKLLPFELLMFLGVLAVLALLYIISAVVSVIQKIKSRKK